MENSQIEITGSIFFNNTTEPEPYLKTKQGPNIAFADGTTLTVTQRSYATVILTILVINMNILDVYVWTHY